MEAVGSANDDLEGGLALLIFGIGDEELAQMMPGTPGRAVDRAGLKQIGTGPGIAKRGDAVAEGGHLTGDLKVLHEGEVIFVQLCHRPSGAGDNDQQIGRLGIAIGGHSLGCLHIDGQGNRFGKGCQRHW